MKEDLQYIFVHGLSGWGHYDQAYQRMPCWGMRNGDLITYLNGKGFSCAAASVAPSGSAWDRACELYAQLTGTRTDYGAAHSKKYHHERYGRDFSADPLIEWKEDTRLVLLGHSFGGATVRLFAELSANGDPSEREEGGEISPFFRGGGAKHIVSVITLAAPTNGTTAYDMFKDADFHPEEVKVPFWSPSLAALMSSGTSAKSDGRDERDYAAYDMHIDNALALNQRIVTQPDVYYFAVPCSYTEKQADGTHRPKKGMEPLFVMRASQIGAYTGKTAGGYPIDENWRENDGLVNTLSAGAPFGAPAKAFDRDHIEAGVWNVFPPFNGDHMALQGGLMKKHDIRAFYLDLLEMINGLK